MVGAYRPFFKQHLYFSRNLVSRIRDFPNIYPSHESENIGISIVDEGRKYTISFTND